MRVFGNTLLSPPPYPFPIKKDALPFRAGQFGVFRAFYSYRGISLPLGKVPGLPQKIHLVGQTKVHADAFPLPCFSRQRSHCGVAAALDSLTRRPYARLSIP
jgi:hypothetical protein